jgi:hypothetical protein
MARQILWRTTANMALHAFVHLFGICPDDRSLCGKVQARQTVTRPRSSMHRCIYCQRMVRPKKRSKGGE